MLRRTIRRFHFSPEVSVAKAKSESLHPSHLSSSILRFVPLFVPITGANKKRAPQVLAKQQLTKHANIKAERTGFEPVMEVSPHTGLAIRRFRPLSHLSELGNDNDLGEIGQAIESFGFCLDCCNSCENVRTNKGLQRIIARFPTLLNPFRRVFRTLISKEV